MQIYIKYCSYIDDVESGRISMPCCKMLKNFAIYQLPLASGVFGPKPKIIICATIFIALLRVFASIKCMAQRRDMWNCTAEYLQSFFSVLFVCLYVFDACASCTSQCTAHAYTVRIFIRITHVEVCTKCTQKKLK